MDKNKNQTLLYLITLVIILTPLFCLGIANHGLWTADEPRVAEIGREMALTGNWIVPSLNQRPFLEQPPLYYASIAAIFRTCGFVSDKIARIPSALFAFGGCIALFYLGCLLFTPRVGFFSALVLATSFEYFRVAHWLVVDSALTAFIICAMALFMAGYISGRKKEKILYYVFFYISCVFAFYSKGFIGFAIPGLAIIGFLVWEGNLKELLKMRIWLGTCIAAAMIVPWFIGLWNQGGPEHLKVFLIHNHLQRFLPGGSSGHHQPFYYYFEGFIEGFLPWSILIPPAVYFSFRRIRDFPAVHKSGLNFLKCWFLMGFIFLSFASTKRILYLLPVFAPFALLTAWYIDTTLAPRLFMRIERVFHYFFGFLLLIAGLIITPAFLYASKIYPAISSGAVISAIIAASVIVCCFSSFSLWHLNKKNMACFWIWGSGAIIAILIFALVVVMPVLDKFKSFVPFCNQVKTFVKSDSLLFAYAPDETIRGFIPFYTGHYLRETDNKEYLKEIAQKEDRVFVIIRDSRGKLENELISTGKFRVIARQGMKTDRSLVLLTN
jgi:4-amino-4-deoxy-L-arabinose transferase-like glycosyltransferase